MDILAEKSDNQLVALYTEGNAQAFDILIDRYKDKLFAYINYVVRNTDLARDLFQDTFVKAITTLKRGAYTDTGKFGAWLSRIAHNLIIDYYRQNGNDNTVSNDASPVDLFAGASLLEDNIEDRMVSDQILRDVRALIDTLPANQREVLYMRYYQNLSFKEIADVLDISINTALGRMRYAILNLRKEALDRNLQLTA